MTIATETANLNLAFIKYWGDRGHDLHIPSNGFPSMNLTGRRRAAIDDFKSIPGADELSNVVALLRNWQKIVPDISKG